jgi:hypothetical protein
MKLDKENILTQLLVHNYAEAEFSIMDGKKPVKFRTLSAGAQMSIEEIISKLPETSSRVLVLHTYTMELLARTLVQYGDRKFDVSIPEKTLEYIKELPPQILDILSKLRDDFQKSILEISTPEELKTHFFPVNSSEEESNLSTKDLT